MSLLEKLKDPALIKDIINEKTKQLLDEGKLQEAKKFIDLGGKIPQKLSQQFKLAEQFRKDLLFRKAKKCYLKAAEYAEQILETKLAELLKNRGEKAGSLTDILKTVDAINKGIRKSLEDLKFPNIDIYENIIPLLEKNVSLANSLEDRNLKEILVKLKNFTRDAYKKAKGLKKLDEDIKNLIKNL